ncbi:MAG: aminotransferase class IV [Rhodocyclaceae bacterium]|nr:aminotransferase class IV [Rhodocyclaceae bacterium]
MIVRAECGIGSGIVFDSRPEDEFAEWLIKCRFLHRACASFELLETLRLDNGIFWLLARHLERLGHSAEHFGFDATQAEQALTHLAERHPTGTWRVRLLLNRHGEIRTECFALEPTPEGITVAMAVTPMESDHEFLRHKTTDRRAYQGFSPPQGIFDTLLWNTQNEITEFTRGNVVVEFEGQRITPPLICGLLPGVLRAELLARGDIIERVIQKDELSKATRLWWINSLRGTILVDDVLHEALSDVPQPHGCKSGSS